MINRYLRLAQWQGLELEGILQANLELSSHFLFDDRGGLPAEIGGGGGGVVKSERSSLPLETLPSPVIVDMKDDVVEETVSVVSFKNAIGALESGDLAAEVKLGLGKSILEGGLGELSGGSRELRIGVRLHRAESDSEDPGPRRNLA